MFLLTELLLVPLLVLTISGTLLRLVGWTYKRIVIVLSSVVMGLALLMFAALAALQKSTPDPPLLTDAKALEILQTTPEFLKQLHSPAIQWSNRLDPSLEYTASKEISFTAKDGTPIKYASVSFAFVFGEWQFKELSWTTRPTNFLSIRRGSPLQVSHTPDPPGTAWKRQKDGSYTANYPER